MENKAVPQGERKTRRGPRAGLSLLVGGALLAFVCASAAAAPIPARNGQVHACYKFKGKEKGEMRVVAGKRCKRGERRLSWSVAGPAGATGSQGSQGSQGPQGDPGANGEAGGSGSAGTSTLGLETQVATLTLEVEALKQILGGVTNSDLTDTINGLPLLQGTVSSLGSTVADLDSTVSGLDSSVTGLGTTVSGLTAKTDTLCAQAEELTGQTGLLGAAFGDIEVLSGLVTLGLPTVEPLDPFTC